MDADVCIDILRGFPNAVAWLAGLSEPIGVAGFAAIRRAAEYAGLELR
jgi:hypothetical protein